MDRRACSGRCPVVRARPYRRTSLCVGTGSGDEGWRAGAVMSIKDEKQWKDLQELRRIYVLKDPRTKCDSFLPHWLRLERVLDGYRKDIQELNRMFTLEDPRSAVPRADIPRVDVPPKENR